MFTPAMSNVREFLGSWKNLLALGTLPLLGAWIYSRVWMVNPAILGDEYLYSMNARKVGPWDPPVAGDFSNYLFNFVYQGTNLCGDAFYACGKIFNIMFFLGFIFTIFIIALRFLPFLGAYVLMVAAALSPLSVYTSMFLPESMYFFFIGLVLVAVLKAINAFTWQNWALAGAAIGIASLVKPHAWLSAISVGITLLIVGLGRRDLGPKKTLISGLGLVLGAAGARLFMGGLIAGSKAFDFFGQYLDSRDVETLLGQGQAGSKESSGSDPLLGVQDLFAAQLEVHTLTVLSLMALPVLGLIVSISKLLGKRELNDVSALNLFVAIWLMSLVIEIVVFTGWISGLGDDHSTRVLLRYYEFLLVLVPLAGLASAFEFWKHGGNLSAWFRWSLAAVLAAAITPAFTGFFGDLTIQIADAPSLAGLVVSAWQYNTLAVLTVTGLLVFATFPKFLVLAMSATTLLSLVGGGWQAQLQYENFRGEKSPADLAGQYLQLNFNDDDRAQTTVIGTTRFDVTLAALWADSETLAYEVVPPGYLANSDSGRPSDKFVVVIGNDVSSTDILEVHRGDGFAIYSKERN